MCEGGDFPSFEEIISKFQLEKSKSAPTIVNNIHNHFDRCGFTSSIRAQETVDSIVRDSKIQRFDSLLVPETFFQIARFNSVIHTHLSEARPTTVS